MWVEGRNADKPVVDWNDKFSKELKGELSEEVAKKTLGRFLKYNVGISVKLLTGFDLYPDQRLMVKGWLTKNHTLTVASRGLGKSWVFSHFCYLYCLFNPGKTVVMIAPTFRSSRKIVENIDKWANAKEGAILRNCIKRNGAGMLVTKKPDSYIVDFKNGSQIIALPLGDGERLRGYRCSVLAIDEGLLIPQTIIDTVLKPFLVATPEEEIKRRQKIRRAEERKVAAGRLKREDLTKFASDAKMIILSSASYSWQDLFTLYKRYLKIIYAEDDKMMAKLSDDEKKKLAGDKEATAEKEDADDIPATYLIHQLSYKIVPLDRLDKAVRDEIKSGMYSENTIAREYEAQFVQDSDGYFRAKTMEECTQHGENAPCPEIVGDKDAEYLLAIDPNMGGSETNDHFAMCLIKIVNQELSDKTRRKVGLIVHQYANAGAKLEHHIDYLYYLWTHFNIVYIACDTSQGDNMDFISVANTGPQFAAKKIELRPLEVDFGKETFDHLVEEIQRSYNKSDRRIVHKQYFHAAFQRAANEWLQTSFNRRTILFPAKALANVMVMDRLFHQDVGNIINTHPDFAAATDGGSAGNRDDFIEQQDLLTDLVKKECALIEIRTSSLGNTSYDLPQHVKRGSRNASRIRKDNYSALVLGNWALKLYLEAQERPAEVHGEWFASWAR